MTRCKTGDMFVMIPIIRIHMYKLGQHYTAEEPRLYPDETLSRILGWIVEAFGA